MADTRMPNAFFDIVSHPLPPDEQVGPLGGPPAVPNQVILKVLWCVLTTGCRWRDAPIEMGFCGETARRRLEHWEELGVWDRMHMDLLRLLRRNGKLEHETAIVDGVLGCAHGGGEATGPIPVDRRKKGTKYTLLVDKTGVPLAIRGPGASDRQQVIRLVVSQFPEVNSQAGRPRTKPEAVDADAGYGNHSTLAILSCLGMTPSFRRQRPEHGNGLGKVRWGGVIN